MRTILIIFVFICALFFSFTNRGQSFLFHAMPIDESSNMPQLPRNKYGYNRVIYRFSEISDELLDNLDKMGKNDSISLNKYEKEYLYFIFGISESDYCFDDKQVGFKYSKSHFFNDERNRYARGDSLGVGCVTLYIFNSSEKRKTGGYDADIEYWNKIVVPQKTIVKMIKRRRR